MTPDLDRAARDFCRNWPNQKEITVKGSRERCGESGTIDGHPVEMLGLIAIPARDANRPLEGADSTLGVSRNDLRYLVAQKCSNRRT